MPRQSVLFCRLLCGAIAVALSLGAAVRGHAADGWKAGAASVAVTPDGPAWMAGYASRDKPSEGVAQDIYAKALVLQDAGDHTLVIVTLDLISVPGPLRKHVEQHLAATRKLGPESLLMNCSHTHCGPEIRTTGSALEGLDAVRRQEAIDYVNTLQQRILAVIDRAFEQLAPAQLAYQHARAAFAMNRRLPSDRGFQNAPNPDGRVDHDAPVLRVTGEDNSLKAVVFGYACHNTTLGFYEICGDYAGYAQEYLEADHPGTVAMFMMGCGGDQNPYPRRTIELAQQHGRTLANAVETALSTPPRDITGGLRLAFSTAQLDYADAPSREDLEQRAQSNDRYEQRYAERLLKELDAGTLLTSYPAPVQVSRIGNEVLLVALPGETVVDYSLRIKQENQTADGPAVWVAGYSNDVFAYVPSLRVLLEGGYEGGGAMRYMTTVVQPGPFAPNVEQRLMEQVDALIRATGE